MELDIVTYTQAVALEELKYDLTPWFGNAASLYDKNGNHAMYVNYGMMYSGLSDGYISAPLKSQVFRWFREKYGIHHVINWVRDKWEWFTDGNETFFGYADTYHEAEHAVLNKLIELAKEIQDGNDINKA